MDSKSIPVLCHDGAERLFVERAGVGRGEQRCDLLEVPFETRWGDDLERPCRRIARIPEGIGHVAGLEDEIIGPGDADLVPDLDTDLTL